MIDYFTFWINETIFLLGFSSLLLIFHSRSKLTKGYMRSLYTNIFLTITFLFCSSIMHTFRIVFNWDAYLGAAAQYPENAFIGATYVFLFYTALQMLEIGKKFGFND